MSQKESEWDEALESLVHTALYSGDVDDIKKCENTIRTEFANIISNREKEISEEVEKMKKNRDTDTVLAFDEVLQILKH